MAKKEFTDIVIKIAQKECHFKRVTNETLKVFSEKAEQAYNEIVKNFVEEVDMLDGDRERLEKRIALKTKQIDIIESKADPSDEELDKVLNLIEEIEKLEDDLQPVKVQLIELGKTSPNKIYSERVNDLLAEKVETFLDGITANEFLKNSDPVDTIKAQNLEKYYQLAIVGERETKIQLMIKEDVDNFLKDNS